MKGISPAVSALVNYNSVVVLGDGTVRMCGVNSLMAFGDAPAEDTGHWTPIQVPGLAGVRSARMRSTTTIGQLADGSLRGWGMGDYGTLGDGNGAGYSARPHAPTGLGPVLGHYISGTASFAIRADGAVMAWGISKGDGHFFLAPTQAFTVKLGEQRAGRADRLFAEQGVPPL